MAKPRTFQTPAIIIKKTRLGEADTIFTMYTPHLGKIQGIARSVRKTVSRLAGHLELLTYSQVTLAHGKNIDVIIGSQTIDAFMPVKEDLEMVSSGLYMLELVNQFTPEGTSDPAIFELLLSSMGRLSRGADGRVLLRYFEFQLLHHSGYLPELFKCVSCRGEVADGAVSFSVPAGGLVCSRCKTERQLYGFDISPVALHLLRTLQYGDWQDICQEAFDDDCVLEARKLISSYIYGILDRDTRSAAWFEELERLGAG
jgi:DNA repair protein RecO (recombination protein O)